MGSSPAVPGQQTKGRSCRGRRKLAIGIDGGKLEYDSVEQPILSVLVELYACWIFGI
jgi:hypothetical protein